MSATKYSVKCPKCSGQAVAQMSCVGSKGTYRELLGKLGGKRIVCDACGFSQETPPDKCDDYELWYATDFRGKRLWAVNRKHLSFLISWLSGEIEKSDLSRADRALVETLPKWMILA
jgi:hypothetical protein